MSVLEDQKKLLKSLGGIPKIDDNIPEFDYPITIPSQKVEFNRPEPAKDFFYTLRKHINRAVAELEDNQELRVIHYTPSGDETEIVRFGYESPDLVILFARNQRILVNVNSLQISIEAIDFGPDKKQEQLYFEPRNTSGQ